MFGGGGVQGRVQGLGDAGARTATAAYGLAHYGKSLFWQSGEILFAFFLTEVGGLPARDMGFVLAASLLVSAAGDVALGASFRRVLAAMDRACRVQLAGAAASSIALLLLFASHWVPGPGRLAFALSVSVLFRLAYAFYDLPQNAMLSTATANDAARTRVSAIRLFGSGAATLTVALLIAPLLLGKDAGDRSLRFCLMAVGFGVVSVSSAWLLTRAMKTIAARTAPDAAAAPPPPGDARLLLAAVWPLVGLMFVVSLATPVFSKIEPYFAAFVLRDPVTGSGVMSAVALGSTLSQPLWVALLRGRSRAASIAVAAGALMLSSAAFYLLAPGGGIAAIACGAAFGASNGAVTMTLWAAFADTVARRAPDQASLGYALFTGAAKLALAIGALAIGAVLAAVDYRDADRLLLVTAMTVPPLAGGALCLLVSGVRMARR